MKELENMFFISSNASIYNLPESNKLLFVYTSPDDYTKSYCLDNLLDIFNLPYVEEYYLKFDNNNIDQFIDGNIIYKDEKMYKIFFYDLVYPIVYDLIKNHIIENNIKLDNNYYNPNKDNYLIDIWDIRFDFKNKKITCDGSTDYDLDLESFEFPFEILDSILDINKLYNVLNKIVEEPIEKFIMIVRQYCSSLEKIYSSESIFSCSINNDYSGSTHFTYPIFNNELWDGDFHNFILNKK